MALNLDPTVEDYGAIGPVNNSMRNRIPFWQTYKASRICNIYNPVVE